MRFLTEADCGRTGVETCPFARDAVRRTVYIMLIYCDCAAL